MTESAAAAIRAYYERLRENEPLAEAFETGEDVVKFGITDANFGSHAIERALSEQRETTGDWSIESTNLQVVEHGEFARFADEVTMAWTDRESGERRRYDSRWSGVLSRADGEWRFVSMHVSASPE